MRVNINNPAEPSDLSLIQLLLIREESLDINENLLVRMNAVGLMFSKFLVTFHFEELSPGFGILGFEEKGPENHDALV